MPKVLVVDDEPLTHQLVGAILRAIDGMTISTAKTGSEGLAAAIADPPDLVISDISMPDMDGLTLTRKLRESPELAHTMIMLLTARDGAHEKYEGFLLGADDYLTKPFDVVELQLRTRALLRRAERPAAPESGGRSASGHAPLVAGPLALEPQRYLARYQGQEVRLTATELAILTHFVRHPDEVTSAEVILREALNYPAGAGSPQIVHTHLRNIRLKFRQAGTELHHLTSSWQGYLFSTAEPPAQS